MNNFALGPNGLAPALTLSNAELVNFLVSVEKLGCKTIVCINKMVETKYI